MFDKYSLILTDTQTHQLDYHTDCIVGFDYTVMICRSREHLVLMRHQILCSAQLTMNTAKKLNHHSTIIIIITTTNSNPLESDTSVTFCFHFIMSHA